MDAEDYTVGAVAGLTGVSVRKLGISPTPQERLEVFGSTRLEDLADEAERRVGGTADWTQEQQRTSGYTVQD